MTGQQIGYMRVSSFDQHPERQLDGIQKAKAQGVKFGRKKTLVKEQIVELHHRRDQGVLIKTLMQDYSLSKASVYRYLGENNHKGVSR